MPSWKDGDLRIIWSIYIYITWIEYNHHPFSMFLSSNLILQSSKGLHSYKESYLIGWEKDVDYHASFQPHIVCLV